MKNTSLRSTPAIHTSFFIRRNKLRRNEFKAGKLKHYFHKWKELTNDKEILQTVLGLKLEFLGDPPVKHSPYIPQFKKKDESTINL